MGEKPVIRVVASIMPPYVNPCFTSNGANKRRECLVPGIDIEILEDQLIRLGFNVDFVEAKNLSDAITLMELGFADITASLYDIAYVYEYTNLSITMPLTTEKWVFAIKEPNVNHVPNLLLYKCHWSVWLLCLLTFLFVYSYKKFAQFGYYKVFGRVRMSRITHSCPFTLWSMCFGIVLSLYSQNLTIALFMRSGLLPFSNRETLYHQLKAGNCRFVINEHFLEPTLDTFPFLVEETEEFETFDNALQKNSILLLGEYDEVDFVKRIKEGFCHIGLTGYMYSKVLLSRVDGLVLIDLPEIPVYILGNLFRKEFMFKHRLQFINSGSVVTAYENLIKAYVFRTPVASRTNSELQYSDEDGLQLYQVLDTFYFWLLCFPAAFLAFIIQVMQKKFFLQYFCTQSLNKV